MHDLRFFQPSFDVRRVRLWFSFACQGTATGRQTRSCHKTSMRLPSLVGTPTFMSRRDALNRTRAVASRQTFVNTRPVGVVRFFHPYTKCARSSVPPADVKTSVATFARRLRDWQRKYQWDSEQVRRVLWPSAWARAILAFHPECDRRRAVLRPDSEELFWKWVSKI